MKNKILKVLVSDKFIDRVVHLVALLSITWLFFFVAVSSAFGATPSDSDVFYSHFDTVYSDSTVNSFWLSSLENSGSNVYNRFEFYYSPTSDNFLTDISWYVSALSGSPDFDIDITVYNVNPNDGTIGTEKGSTTFNTLTNATTIVSGCAVGTDVSSCFNQTATFSTPISLVAGNDVVVVFDITTPFVSPTTLYGVSADREEATSNGFSQDLVNELSVVYFDGIYTTNYAPTRPSSLNVLLHGTDDNNQVFTCPLNEYINSTGDGCQDFPNPINGTCATGWYYNSFGNYCSVTPVPSGGVCPLGWDWVSVDNSCSQGPVPVNGACESDNYFYNETLNVCSLISYPPDSYNSFQCSVGDPDFFSTDVFVCSGEFLYHLFIPKYLDFSSLDFIQDLFTQGPFAVLISFYDLLTNVFSLDLNDGTSYALTIDILFGEVDLLSYSIAEKFPILLDIRPLSTLGLIVFYIFYFFFRIEKLFVTRN